jgi:hypothetical protein
MSESLCTSNTPQALALKSIAGGDCWLRRLPGRRQSSNSRAESDSVRSLRGAAGSVQLGLQGPVSQGSALRGNRDDQRLLPACRTSTLSPRFGASRRPSHSRAVAHSAPRTSPSYTESSGRGPVVGRRWKRHFLDNCIIICSAAALPTGLSLWQRVGFVLHLHARA